MIGRVIKYNDFRETGIIYSFTNRRTYLFQKCNAIDGDIGFGYVVDFRVFYDEEAGKKYAANVNVIESCGSDSKVNVTNKKHKKKRKRKPTNASRYSYGNNKKFQKFVKDFMREQRNKKRGEV